MAGAVIQETCFKQLVECECSFAFHETSFLDARAALNNKKVPAFCTIAIYEGWNFNSGNYLFTTDTK